ncbi:MAG: type II toxin-antitoxin system VapC family toxin [Leptolyngbyaceae cyanobacterium]
MKLCYLDASAWVKRYCQEAGTQATQALFAGDSILACASLGFIEVLATLSRKAKAGQLNPEQFQQKQQEVTVDWEQFIQVQLSDEVLQEAVKLTAALALRGADGIHLASAIILKRSLSEADEFLLVACDLELLSAAEQTGIAIFNPAVDLKAE